MDIPRGPDAVSDRVPPHVLKLQGDEIMAMMSALAAPMDVESLDEILTDVALRPLLMTIPSDTLGVMLVAINQFVLECIVAVEDEEGPPIAHALLQLAQKAADIGHRCGYLRGIAGCDAPAATDDHKGAELDET